jgi:hypothetical protein
MFSGSNANQLDTFRLMPASPFRATASDGKNPGADIALVEAAIAGVAW